MVYNRITLAFPAKHEKQFLESYFYGSLPQVRVALLLVAVMYGAFGYLDLLIFPAYVKIFHFIRFAIVVPLIVIVYCLSYTKIFQKIWQWLLFICLIIGGTGISTMIMLAQNSYEYLSGMMLIFSAGYFFVKLRFFYATIGGWLVLVIYNLGAIFHGGFDKVLIINTNFFFVSANILGMLASYNIEFYARRNFFLNHELDNEKLHVEEINKNLEKTVEERTIELQRAKERAEESDRLKSAFLANMSHEIRTPMNGILGFAEILKEPDLTSDQQQEYLGIIEKSGTRMLNIINDIVDISKIEAGLVKLKISESNINEQIEYIYTFFKPEVEANGMVLSFKNSLPIQESVIYTDREKTYAILTNLVKNAIKYSHKGAIEFGYSKKGEFLEFFVKDNGIGIPKDRQNAIFERFIQADIADLQARQGAGLGLSITKAYVEMLGGKIWVESEQGIGSTFYFTLPYNTGPENIAIQKDLTGIDLENVISPQALQLKVLIAEDDEASERLLGIEVKKLSKEIIRVRTGFEAVVAFRDNPDLDLILMDIQMPGMDGYEATRQIRQMNKEVVIIAQTAFGLSGDREKAIEAGCSDYISKPIKIVELQKLIRKYFKK